MLKGAIGERAERPSETKNRARAKDHCGNFESPLGRPLFQTGVFGSICAIWPGEVGLVFRASSLFYLSGWGGLFSGSLVPRLVFSRFTPGTRGVGCPSAL